LASEPIAVVATINDDTAIGDAYQCLIARHPAYLANEAVFSLSAHDFSNNGNLRRKAKRWNCRRVIVKPVAALCHAMIFLALECDLRRHARCERECEKNQ